VPTLEPGQPSLRVPMMMYHYVRTVGHGDQQGYALSVTPQDFGAQMDWLTAHDYHPVLVRQVVAYLQGRGSLPAHPVALTFDDGYQDFWTDALPVLAAHGFVATAYIVTGFLGQPGYLTADEVTAVAQLGYEVGSHTVSHVDLTAAPPPRLHAELADSRQRLEQLAQGPVLDFCYPSGRYNATVVAAVQAAGYVSATTTTPGIGVNLGNAFTWPRLRVSGGESIDDFARSVSGA